MPRPACFDIRPTKSVDRSIFLVIPPDLHHDQRKRFERIGNGEPVEAHEMHILAKGGDKKSVSATCLPSEIAMGRSSAQCWSCVTRASARQEEIERARLAAIVESSDDAIIAKDLNGVITSWNAAAEKMFGYTTEEIVGRSILTLIPPELQHEEPTILGQIRAGNRVAHLETQRLHKSGKRIEVSLTSSPIRNHDGKVIGASKSYATSPRVARPTTPAFGWLPSSNLPMMRLFPRTWTAP